MLPEIKLLPLHNFWWTLEILTKELNHLEWLGNLIVWYVQLLMTSIFSISLTSSFLSLQDELRDLIKKEHARIDEAHKAEESSRGSAATEKTANKL